EIRLRRALHATRNPTRTLSRRSARGRRRNERRAEQSQENRAQGPSHIDLLDGFGRPGSGWRALSQLPRLWSGGKEGGLGQRIEWTKRGLAGRGPQVLPEHFFGAAAQLGGLLEVRP